MFWSSPSADIQMIIFLLVVSLFIALVTYIISRRILLSIFVMSVLSNVVLYLGIDYNLAEIYDISLLFKFVRDIFPYINIVLFFGIIAHFLWKKNKTKKS